MSNEFKKNTIAEDISIFIRSLADAEIGETGLDVSTYSIARSIDGGAFSPIVSEMVEISHGYYNIPQLSAAELNGNSVILHGIDKQGVPTAKDWRQIIRPVVNTSEDLDGRFDSVDTRLTAIEGAIPNKVGQDESGIDHDYGGTDNLRALDGAGSPIPNADIQIFLASDWDANNRSTAYVATNGAWSETDADGRWKYQVSLNAGDYKMVVQIPGHSQQTITDFTVA